MTSDKVQRDSLNNQRFRDIYIHASQEPWIQFYPGIGFKLLRATQETGHWTVILNCARGLAFLGTNISGPVSTMSFRAKWR